MRIWDCRSDVCSSDLLALCGSKRRARLVEFLDGRVPGGLGGIGAFAVGLLEIRYLRLQLFRDLVAVVDRALGLIVLIARGLVDRPDEQRVWRSEEHTSDLQSLMRSSYAVFCLKNKN